MPSSSNASPRGWPPAPLPARDRWTALARPPAERLLGLWARLAPLPGGRWLFSRLLGVFIPYTGTIGARVLELAPGRCRIALRERRRVRNHLGSVHAVALVNLGEVASGLALTMGLPPGVRGIVTELRATYHRKARGTLVAECETAVPPVETDTEHDVEARILDAGGELVATVRARWRLGLRPAAG